jgi:hypothetical protein
MDFATCPACQQSVLDDDAENCPFCGASMKAKPGAAKPATKPAAPAVASAAAKVGATKGPAGKTSRAAAPDDSPFDLTDDLTAKAIPSSATRTKSRTLAVKCPMCETVGYVPADAAGKAVKCANPKCLVPVFDAPAPEPVKPAAPPPPPKRQRSIVMVAGVTLAIMAVGGVLARWIALQPENVDIKGPSAEDLELIKQMNPSEPAALPGEKKGQPQEAPEEAVAKDAQPQERTLENWLAATFKVMNDAALQQSQNRSKPFCRRLAAEAYAITGDVPGAQEQLVALERVGRDVPFYRVMPLVEIAWQQMRQGDRAAAAKSTDEAWAAAAKLPKTGRDRLETAIALSALLIAHDRDKDALTLLERHESDEALAQLAAQRRAALANRVFNLAEVAKRRPALQWHAPLIVGVVQELVARGEPDAAQKWATKLKQERDRAEAVAAWVEEMAWSAQLHHTNSDVKALKTVAEGLSSPGDILALSRLGVALAWAGDQASAKACLDEVVSRLSSAKPFPEEPLPEDTGALAMFHPPEPKPREFLAFAAGEAAHLAAQLGEREQAANLLQTALSQIRSLGPNPVEIERRRQQYDPLAATRALREELKEKLKLKKSEDALAAANDFKKNLDELARAAEQRVRLQIDLLTQVIDWGLPDFAWDYIRKGPTAADAAQADNLIFSELSSRLAQAYHAAGNQDQFELVTASWNQLVPNRPLATVSAADQIAADLQAGNPKSYDHAAGLINALKKDPAAQDALAMESVCQAAAAKRYAPAFALIARIADPVLKEECYLLTAAIAGQQQDLKPVDLQIMEVGQATEQVALCRGVIVGRLSGPDASSPESTAKANSP